MSIQNLCPGELCGFGVPAGMEEPSTSPTSSAPWVLDSHKARPVPREPSPAPVVLGDPRGYSLACALTAGMHPFWVEPSRWSSAPRCSRAEGQLGQEVMDLLSRGQGRAVGLSYTSFPRAWQHCLGRGGPVGKQAPLPFPGQCPACGLSGFAGIGAGLRAACPSWSGERVTGHCCGRRAGS